MPRAVWSGTVSFGLVSIPVALYPATEPKDVRFHLFDRQGRRVRYRRVAEPSGWDDAEAAEGPAPSPGPEAEPEHRAIESPASASEGTTITATERSGPPTDGGIAYDQLLRGYEVEPGRFAMLEQEEIEQVRPERSTTIELEDFVELDRIDPVFFEKTYFVAPRRDADVPYVLLRRALESTARVGIGRFVLRTKPHLVALRPMHDALALEILYFGDEVRSPSDVMSVPDATVTDREVRVAEQLVEMLATSWDPARYADQYREELLGIIARKTTVDRPEAPDRPAPAPTRRIEELMEALKQSVEEAKSARGDDRGRRAG